MVKLDVYRRARLQPRLSDCDFRNGDDGVALSATQESKFEKIADVMDKLDIEDCMLPFSDVFMSLADYYNTNLPSLCILMHMGAAAMRSKTMMKISRFFVEKGDHATLA